MRRIDALHAEALYGSSATRQLEHLAQSQLPAHTLMQRAGLALARLALALTPHSQRIWLACGPGNNGGDGFEAAMHLQAWGKSCVITSLGSLDTLPCDAAASWVRAQAAGATWLQEPPDNFDLCIDALLGVGSRPIDSNHRLADWIHHINCSQQLVLSVDLPSGLSADTGTCGPVCVRANHTLSLLTLKPGLFIAQGRDMAATVWFDPLGLDLTSALFANTKPDAGLLGQHAHFTRLHASHKGSYGDVAIIGGAPGMAGSALLAATAALHSGAGRIFLGLLDSAAPAVDVLHPELMLRSPAALLAANLCTVIGCGGADLLKEPLTQCLAQSAALVIDADGLNTLAGEPELKTMLNSRAQQGWCTVLTPHPLEAARLLGCSTNHIQSDRLACAHELAHQFNCTVVLKGSGTVVAQPGEVTRINPTGNAKLATAGTGDVLAGMIGARLALGLSALEAACQAVYTHGRLADAWPPTQHLSASQLV
jgi:hydroxyethylthiazole kinase-like uncharacterized protein yjeF